MTYTRTILKDSDTSWNRVPFQVSFGKQFTTMAESYSYQLNPYGKMAKDAGDSENQISASELEDEYGTPPGMSKTYYRDTRLGSNDAINCIWQFSRDDDIVHPMMITSGDPHHPIGLGRVYASTTEQNQNIAWFTFGTIKFTNLTEFYTKAAEQEVIKLNNTGFTKAGLSDLFGNLASLAISIPLLPITWLFNIFSIANDYPVSRYCDLRTTMHVYYKHVDSILAEWIINTGLYGNGTGLFGMTSGWSTEGQNALPLAIKLTGASIWDIIARKAEILNGKRTNIELDSEANTQVKKTAVDYDNETNNVWNNNGIDWTDQFVASAFGATQFLGFRIEKSVDASESFSNSTGPSAIAEKINSMSREYSAKRFNLGAVEGGQMNTGSEVIDKIMGSMGDLLGGITDSLNIGDLASMVTGGAFIDIPEQYSGSSFSKSHSISLQLRSPYGDVVSIYQSIMVPLACLLAAALPKAAGPNSYSSPFMLRMYIKGMASVPFGIIDSLNIKRGAAEHGWNYQNLPTCVDVSLTIKDLSPAIYMAIKSETFKSLLGVNNSFNEYMLTLSGTGLLERMSRYEQFKRNIMYISHKTRNQTFNPNYWASSLGYTSVVRTIGMILPWNDHPRN